MLRGCFGKAEPAGVVGRAELVLASVTLIDLQLRLVAMGAELTGAESFLSSDRQDHSAFQKLWELNDHS